MNDRNDNFSLIEDLFPIAEDVLNIKDEIGAKKANIYLLKRSETTDLWTQFLPTPTIVDLGHNLKLLESGEVKSGDLLLRGFPRNKYNEIDLETANVDGDQVFYVIQQKAYTASHIRQNYLTYDVLVSRYEAFDEFELVPFQNRI